MGLFAPFCQLAGSRTWAYPDFPDGLSPKVGCRFKARRCVPGSRCSGINFLWDAILVEVNDGPKGAPNEGLSGPAGRVPGDLLRLGPVARALAGSRRPRTIGRAVGLPATEGTTALGQGVLAASACSSSPG